MLRLNIKDRFGPNSHIYFDNCREHYENFTKYNAKISAKADEMSLGKCPATELLSLMNRVEGYWASAVVFGAMCLEAFIYDYVAHNFSDTYAKNYLDQLNLVSKWVVIPKLVTGKDFPTEGQAFERLRKLCKERNELVHAKSKPSPSSDPDVLLKAVEYNKKTKETRERLNPYQTVKEVLTELRKLEGDGEWNQ